MNQSPPVLEREIRSAEVFAKDRVAAHCPDTDRCYYVNPHSYEVEAQLRVFEIQAISRDKTSSLRRTFDA